MTESEYLNKVRKLGSHKHRFTHSYGTNEAYLYYRKTCGAVEASLYRKIINKINRKFHEMLLLGKPVTFPIRMGSIELAKTDVSPKIIDGKLRINHTVDWDATCKLWYSDEEAKEKKQLVYCDSHYVFRFCYRKSKAIFKNKAFIKYYPNRFLKRNLCKNIRDGKVDAFLLY